MIKMKNKKWFLFSSFILFGTLGTSTILTSCAKTKVENPEQEIKDENSNYYKQIQYLLNNKFDEKDFFWNEDDVLPDEKNVTILDAEIVEWKDGDTPVIKINDSEFDGLYNLRIELIDTPEKGLKKGNAYVKSTGLEKTYADRATEFAKRILPKGTKIKYVYSGKGTPGRSYERITGLIFFGRDKHYKNYSVELVKAGLSLPNSNKQGMIKMNYPQNIEYTELIKIAKAYQQSKNNRFGIWEQLNRSSELTFIKEIYNLRGNPPILDIFDENAEDNIFLRHQTNQQKRKK